MADEVGEGSVKVQETTRKPYTKAENENLAARISTAFAGSSSFTLEHYLETAFSFPECQYVRLYRVAANGAKAAVERLEPGINVPEIEPTLFHRHRDGQYDFS